VSSTTSTFETVWSVLAHVTVCVVGGHVGHVGRFVVDRQLVNVPSISVVGEGHRVGGRCASTVVIGRHRHTAHSRGRGGERAQQHDRCECDSDSYRRRICIRVKHRAGVGLVSERYRAVVRRWNGRRWPVPRTVRAIAHVRISDRFPLSPQCRCTGRAAGTVARPDSQSSTRPTTILGPVRCGDSTLPHRPLGRRCPASPTSGGERRRRRLGHRGTTPAARVPDDGIVNATAGRSGAGRGSARPSPALGALG